MSDALSPVQSGALAQRIAAFEARTGVQLVAAVVGRSDLYPEVRWKAFALGASLASLFVVAAEALAPRWHDALAVLVDVVAILGLGAANALAAHYLPKYARLFVRHNRAEAETRQHAEHLFLRRGLFATRGRNAVLVLASLFERCVVIHADSGIEGALTQKEWHEVVERISARLREGDRAGALGEGIDRLEALLVAKGRIASGAVANELADAPLAERGA